MCIYRCWWCCYSCWFHDIFSVFFFRCSSLWFAFPPCARLFSSSCFFWLLDFRFFAIFIVLFFLAVYRCCFFMSILFVFLFLFCFISIFLLFASLCERIKRFRRWFQWSWREFYVCLLLFYLRIGEMTDKESQRAEKHRAHTRNAKEKPTKRNATKRFGETIFYRFQKADFVSFTAYFLFLSFLFVLYVSCFVVIVCTVHSELFLFLLLLPPCNGKIAFASFWSLSLCRF